MDNFLLILHSLLRWLILILLVLSILRSWNGWKQKKPFTAADRKSYLFTMICAHITLLIGVYQLLFGRMGVITAGLPPGVELMKNDFFRFYWVEHPFGMLVSILLITMGNGMAKKQIPDERKFKKAFWYFFIALILILVSIPWPFRGQSIGRGLLPTM